MRIKNKIFSIFFFLIFTFSFALFGGFFFSVYAQDPLLIEEEDDLLIDESTLINNEEVKEEDMLDEESLEFEKEEEIERTEKKETIIEPPLITEIPEQLKFGESLTIRGISVYSDIAIRIFIQKGENQPQVREVRTDDSGNWSYFHNRPIEEGNYKIWVIAINKEGKESLSSRKFSLIVLPNSFLEMLKGPTLVIIILLIIIIMLIFLVIYQKRKIRAKKKFINKENKNKEKIISKVFNALREEVKEQVIEKDSRSNLIEALNLSEEFVKKELENVKK